jgi:hypothetical protein
MREIGAQITAARAAAVIHETFGHLDAKPGECHKGWFVFINGQHGDMDVVYSEFQTFGEGPGYFTDRDDFIWELIRDDGPCAAVGIYRFDGEYRQPKRKGAARFVGKITSIQVWGG